MRRPQQTTATGTLLGVSPERGTDAETAREHTRRIEKVHFAKMRHILLLEIAETCSL